MAKLRVALIGAGSIAKRHLKTFNANPNADVVCICDMNEERVQAMAKEFNVPNYCTDYMDILNDENVDAVVIVTPTFTHAPFVLEALKHNKHVMCEKPPALNVQEAQACADAAAKSDKLLMHAFSLRFSGSATFMKNYINSGAMGDIYFAEAYRMERCSKLGGWFVNKDRAGGGKLIDACIHQLDLALYMMGFPKIKSVKGFSSNINAHLPGVMKGSRAIYSSADKNVYERTVESVASGMITFENGGCLYVKASDILNVVEEDKGVELCGTKAGIKISGKGDLRMVTVDDSGYYLQSSPVLTESVDSFTRELDHFVDCCVNGTECICKPEQAVEVMRVISAIYESAETGKEVVF